MTGSLKLVVLIAAILTCSTNGSIRSSGLASLERSLFYENYYHDLSLSFSMTYSPASAPTKSPPPIGGKGGDKKMMGKKGMKDKKGPKCKPGKKDKKGPKDKGKGKGSVIPPGKGKGNSYETLPPGKGKGGGSVATPTDSPGIGKGSGMMGKGSESQPTGKGKGVVTPTESPGKGKGPGVMGKGKRVLVEGDGDDEPDDMDPQIPPGKGKGMDGKGKGKGKGGPIPDEDDDMFCTEHPTTEPATKPPVQPTGPTNPPRPGTSTPSRSPVTEIPGATSSPTRSPGPSENKSVVLSPFSVLYTIQQTRIPATSDYVGLTDLTATYLDSFFKTAFESVKEVVYLSSTTDNTASDFRLGEPVIVIYNVTILFSGTSSLIPQVSELDSIVQMAFTGQQGTMYLGQLMALPSTNIFQTTSEVSFSASAAAASHGGRGRVGGVKSAPLNSSAGIAAAAGAGALVFAAAAYLLSRRRRGEEGNRNLEKPFDHDGHITVAGDTYAETFAGDSQSGVLSSRTGMDSHWSNYNEGVNLMQRPPSPDPSPDSVDMSSRQRGDESVSESDTDSVRAQAHHHQFEDVVL